MRYVLIVFVVILGFTSCSVQKPSVGIPQGVEIEKLSVSGIRLKLLLPIENPNNMSFNIKSMDLSLFVNGKNVGKISKMKKIKIAANSRQSYPVSFELSSSEAMSKVLFLISEFQGSTPLLELKGSLKVSKLGISKRIPIEHNYKF